MKLEQTTLNRLVTDPDRSPTQLLSCLRSDDDTQTQLLSLFLAKDATFDSNSRWLSVALKRCEVAANAATIISEAELRIFLEEYAPISKVRQLSSHEFFVETDSAVNAHILKLAFDGLAVETWQVRFDLESICQFADADEPPFRRAKTLSTAGGEPEDRGKLTGESEDEPKMPSVRGRARNRLRFKGSAEDDHKLLRKGSVNHQEDPREVCEGVHTGQMVREDDGDELGADANQDQWRQFPTLEKTRSPTQIQTQTQTQNRKQSLVGTQADTDGDSMFPKTPSEWPKQRPQFQKWSEDFSTDAILLIKDTSKPTTDSLKGFPGIKQVSSEINIGYIQFPGFANAKFTCRYDIAISHTCGFPIAKKIIGSKGCNMKEIIEKSRAKSGSKEDVFDAVKLRLRGRGSGFKEGHEKKESNEMLHLCVSAKNEALFATACYHVEKLLQKIYEDHLGFLRRSGDSRAVAKDKEYLESFRFRKHLPN